MGTCDPRAFPEEVLMSIQSSGSASVIEKLNVHLKTERYAASIQRLYPPLAQRFLEYLESKSVAFETATTLDVEDFLRRELRIF